MQRGLLLVEEVTIFKLVDRSHERHRADAGNQTPAVACHALVQGDTRPVVGDPAGRIRACAEPTFQRIGISIHPFKSWRATFVSIAVCICARSNSLVEVA